MRRLVHGGEAVEPSKGFPVGSAQGVHPVKQAAHNPALCVYVHVQIHVHAHVNVHVYVYAYVHVDAYV